MFIIISPVTRCVTVRRTRSFRSVGASKNVRLFLEQTLYVFSKKYFHFNISFDKAVERDRGICCFAFVWAFQLTTKGHGEVSSAWGKIQIHCPDVLLLANTHAEICWVCKHGLPTDTSSRRIYTNKELFVEIRTYMNRACLWRCLNSNKIFIKIPVDLYEEGTKMRKITFKKIQSKFKYFVYPFHKSVLLNFEVMSIRCMVSTTHPHGGGVGEMKV